MNLLPNDAILTKQEVCATLPQTTLLLQELADLGYDLPRDALTPEEGAEALAKILDERRKAL